MKHVYDELFPGYKLTPPFVRNQMTTKNKQTTKLVNIAKQLFTSCKSDPVIRKARSKWQSEILRDRCLPFLLCISNNWIRFARREKLFPNVNQFCCLFILCCHMVPQKWVRLICIQEKFHHMHVSFKTELKTKSIFTKKKRVCVSKLNLLLNLLNLQKLFGDKTYHNHWSEMHFLKLCFECILSIFPS